MSRETTIGEFIGSMEHPEVKYDDLAYYLVDLRDKNNLTFEQTKEMMEKLGAIYEGIAENEKREVEEINSIILEKALTGEISFLKDSAEKIVKYMRKIGVCTR